MADQHQRRRLLFGLARFPDGARKRALAQAMAAMLEQDFAGRILSFDVEAATAFAGLAAERESTGQPVSLADAQIASICLVHQTQLDTRNTRHFEGLGLVLVNCIFRFIVTAHSGNVTRDSGHRDRGLNHRFRHRDR